EYGIADQVVMTGSVSDEELLGHYRAANAFVSLSEHEGFGMPLIEAMSLDLPVIAYDAGAIRDTMGDGGMLIPDKRPATILAQLQRLKRDGPWRRELIRRQRTHVLRYGRTRLEADLRTWLRNMGALSDADLAALPSRSDAADDPGEGQPSGRVHYV